jgi:nucleotide-binding universal stress UspA family protein
MTVLEYNQINFAPELYTDTLEKAHQEWMEANQLLRQHAANYLDIQARSLRSEGLDVAIVAVMADFEKSAADIIVDYAKAHQIDMIIMSTHGRSGLSRWALGSVTDKVVHHSGGTSVLVIT